MHARHRSPGNGYRSGSMGMGLPASRISPESSGRGHGFYNSEYRNFKRGFGRGQGQSRSFQPPAPTPRRGDIFMEAGRLAAEYLVSQGLLPPSALSGKWQNGSLKKQVGDFQDFRSQEGDNLHVQPDGRTSALARLGSSVSDAGFGRRRYTDDYNSTGSRNHFKGRKKESFRNYSSDWSRDYGRSGSWSDRNRASPAMEGDDDDSFSGHHEEQQPGKDVVNEFQKSGFGESALKSEEAGNSESELDKYNLHEDMASKASSSSSGKDLQQEADGEPSKRSDDLNAGTEEFRDGSNNDETEEKVTMVESPIPHCAAEGDSSGKNTTDLLALCKFAKIPTKTRSSLAAKASKVDSIPKKEEESNSDVGLPRGSEILVKDESLDRSSTNMLSNKIQDSRCPDSEISKGLSLHSVEDVRELGNTYNVEHGRCTRSQSFPDRVLLHDSDEELVQEIAGIQRSCSMGKERGEKRPLEDSNLEEGTKKPREWLQPVPTKADDFFHLSGFGEKKGSSEEGRTLNSERVDMTVDQDSFANSSQFSDIGGGGPSVKYAEEKQLFPSSFKICDLNLMEASDINDTSHSNPIILYPTTSETKTEAAPIDVDLTMSNPNDSGGVSRHTSSCKDIEVIDLENDSPQQDKAADNLERKSEPMFVNMNGDITDVPDHYDGLILTEFLRTFQNCPNVPEDINSHTLQNDNINPMQNDDINPMQNPMGLHNGEGALGDDDSIYMSLGEIPLSFLPAWEQPPTQGYEKPF